MGRFSRSGTALMPSLPVAEMGAVYWLFHLLLKKRVAMKQNRGLLHVARPPEREAIAGAHIQHALPSVATDFGELDMVL